MKKIFLFFVLFLSSILVYSKEKTIQGHISSIKKQLIIQANVFITNSLGETKEFTFSNSNGDFEIIYIEDIDLELNVTCLGYKPYSIKLNSLKSNSIDITLIESQTLIDEIIIKPSNDVLDTINIKTKALCLSDDDNLKNILSKSPNFEIDDDGSIVYKGKNIDKILINGKIYFEYQNSIALEKIENNIISSLQVINNYKDPFALDLNNKDETVLNIKSKDKFNDLLSGSLLIGSDFENKYKVDATLFKYSDGLNGFVINKTNNIGETTIKIRELQEIFNNDQPFSIFVKENVNKLFKTEHRKIDYVSNSNFSIKKINNKYKFNTVFYYFDKNNENNTSYEISEIDEIIDYNQQETKLNANSFFSKTNLDYKLGTDNLLKYNLSITKNNLSNSINSSSTYYDELFFEDEKYIVNAFNKISLNTKINHNCISKIEAGVYNENSEINDSIKSLYDYNLDFDKQVYFLNGEIQYKVFNKNTFTFNLNSSISKENISFDIQELVRNTKSIDMFSSLTGVNILERVSYKINYGLKVSNRFYSGINETRYLLPFEININYENKLSRIYGSSYLSYEQTPLVYGIESRLNDNKIIIGDELSPFNYESNYISKIGYAYNNVFKGKSLNVYFSYTKMKNDYAEYLTEIDDYGLYNYILTKIPFSYNYSLSSRFSSLNFRYSSYPIKTSFNSTYIYKTYSKDVDLSNSKLTTIDGCLETITDRKINFELFIKSSFQRASTLDNTTLSGFFKTKIKFGYFNSFISYTKKYIYSNNDTFISQGLDLKFSYQMKNFLFNINGVNVNDALNLFGDNNVYETYSYTINSYNIITYYNKSINYLLFEIKYKF